MRSAKLLLTTILLFLFGCTRNPSIVFDPAGPHAEKTRTLFFIILGVDIIVFCLVIGFLLYSLWLRHTEKIVEPLEPSPQTEKTLIFFVSTAVVVTAIILTSFVAASYGVDKALSQLDQSPDLEIEIRAHQWWWEVIYKNQDKSQIFTTANEIHVPLHKKIRFVLKTSDVIHSLWFPNLAGKKDIIPGKNNDLFIQADKQGVWLGRCAEFCGLQHAFMQLKLFADPEADFEAWRQAQLLPAAEPVDEAQRRGKEIFETRACIMCHTIRTKETTGWSDFAPDLTHLKSRTTIGAGAAENTKGYLGGWILNPHGIKPGVHMPTILQEPKDFQDLLAYLESLK